VERTINQSCSAIIMLVSCKSTEIEIATEQAVLTEVGSFYTLAIFRNLNSSQAKLVGLLQTSDLKNLSYSYLG